MSFAFAQQTVHRTGNFLRLSARERRLTLTSAVWLVGSLVLRRCLAAERLVSLGKPEPVMHAERVLFEPATRYAITERKAALERASRALRVKNCLVRATALGLSLKRAGIGSTLHIGVRKTPQGGLAAHAWVTIAGSTVIGGDPMQPTYTEMLPAVFRRSPLTRVK